jgi:hypothetical protein
VKDERWGKVDRQPPRPEDHWYFRAVHADEQAESVPIRAKPQTFKRLTLRSQPTSPE